MRILMTTDTVGGVWTYSIELAAALRAHGVVVTLAAMGGPLSDHQRDTVAALGLDVRAGDYKLEWMADPWADVEAAGRWLIALERAVRPDVVHLNQYAHGPCDWSAPLVVAAHSCVCSWWRQVHGTCAPAEWDRYRQAVTRGLEAADAIVTPTRAMLAMLRECHGPLPDARVIPNGRDPALFAPRPKQPYIFATGRFWDEAKNMAALEQAAAGLSWPVYVCGSMQAPDGEARQPTSLQPRGPLAPAQVAAWMSEAAIYTLPARYEPFGLSILEAALAGCALVLGDIPTLREIWRDAAIFVDPRDSTALAAALQSLIDAPARRRALGAKARQIALTFTPQRMAEAYLALYRALAGAGESHRKRERLAKRDNAMIPLK